MFCLFCLLDMLQVFNIVWFVCLTSKLLSDGLFFVYLSVSILSLGLSVSLSLSVYLYGYLSVCLSVCLYKWVNK